MTEPNKDISQRIQTDVEGIRSEVKEVFGTVSTLLSEMDSLQKENGRLLTSLEQKSNLIDELLLPALRKIALGHCIPFVAAQEVLDEFEKRK